MLHSRPPLQLFSYPEHSYYHQCIICDRAASLLLSLSYSQHGNERIHDVSHQRWTPPCCHPIGPMRPACFADFVPGGADPRRQAACRSSTRVLLGSMVFDSPPDYGSSHPTSHRSIVPSFHGAITRNQGMELTSDME
jgi:hypothetical protein